MECAQPTFAVPDKPLSRFGVPKNVHVATPFPGTSNRDRSRNSMFTNATPSFITPYKNSARFVYIYMYMYMTDVHVHVHVHVLHIYNYCLILYIHIPLNLTLEFE